MNLDTHPETTDEIRSLMSDLGVLGKADFKLLLKWRMQIRKEHGLEKKKKRRGSDGEESSSDDSSGDEEEAGDSEDEEEENDQLLNEMGELKASMDAQARRDKKKKAKIKAKERLRVARGLASTAEAITEQEMDLFSLARIKTKGALDVVSKAPTPGLDAAHDSDEDPDSGADSDADSDTEEDERRLDKEVDEMWAMYKARRSKKGEKFTEPTKGRDKRVQIGAGELDDGSDEESASDDDVSDPADDEFKSDSDELEWEDDEDAAPKGKKSKPSKDTNPLLVDLGAKPKKNAAKVADMWFSNDLFSSGKKAATVAADKDSDEDEEEEAPKPKVESKKAKKEAKKEAKKKKSADEEEEENFDDLRAKAKAAKEKKDKADAKAKAKKTGGKVRDDTYDDDSDEEQAPKKGKKVGADDFEIVAAEDDAPSSSETDDDEKFDYDSEVDELSDDTRARILAIGKKMIRKKDREELIDDAYNRYAFDDEDLPDWFAEDERRFMRPLPQFTKEDMDEAKAQLAAVNTRPIKKVAEAKWRKKKRAESKIAQARVRAAAIVDQEDMPDVSKAKEIERVFAKARKSIGGGKGGKGKDRKVVVARKFHRGNAGGPSVDKRQLKDLRAQKRSLKRSGGGKGGRGGGGKGRGKAGGRGRR